MKEDWTHFNDGIHVDGGTSHVLQSDCVSDHMSSPRPESVYNFRTIRFLRFAIDIIQHYAFLRLTPKVPASGDMKFTSFRDVTIISHTLGAEENYHDKIQSWLRCNPKAIIIVTVEKMAQRVRGLLRVIKDDRITMLTVTVPGIREQMCKGIRSTTTDILVFVDDDTTWSLQTLNYLLAPFCDASVGGVNTMQQVRASVTNSSSLSLWESFGSLNLVRRNILHSTLAYFNHGQVMNLSGRTVAYRTRILKQQEFFEAFTHDYWRGRYLIRTGDDNFLTSWIIQQGWKTDFQNHPDAMIFTTANPDATYLKQVLRWSRDTARYYLKDIGFALRTGRRQDYLRCILNCLANYASDFALLAEMAFLSVESICQALGKDGERMYVLSIAFNICWRIDIFKPTV